MDARGCGGAPPGGSACTPGVPWWGQNGHRHHEGGSDAPTPQESLDGRPATRAAQLAVLRRLYRLVNILAWRYDPLGGVRGRSEARGILWRVNDALHLLITKPKRR